jgi:DNA-binding LacI/PurR family transcriptional regulator
MTNDMRSPIRIQDVAQRAGVSSATVSRVLANKPHVSLRVRKLVTAAIEELDYQPSRVARSLRVQTSKIIGLIISDIQNPFFTSLVRAVEDVAYQNQYALFLCNSDEDIEKERLYVDLMYAERVAGVIIVPTCETDNPCRKLLEANIPIVAVDRLLPDFPVDTLVMDNAAASAEIVTMLIEDGHRDIACIVGRLTTTTGRERRDGYVKALVAHSLPVRPELVLTGPPKEESGYRFTRELLDQSQPPTALFAGNNLLTVGALRAIDERSLRIPEDIAVGAFDDVDWMYRVGPVLVVAVQPAYDIGWTAAELLIKRIGDKHGRSRRSCASRRSGRRDPTDRLMQ